MSPKLSANVCLVCGDTAIGLNYSALTCISCRTFFIRNTTTTKKLKCFKDGNCPIDIATRRSCQSCRLDKCFAIGMKPKPSNAPEKPGKPEKTPNSTEVYLNDCIIEMFNSVPKPELAETEVSLQESTFPLNRKRYYATSLTPTERHLLYELSSAMSAFPDERTLPELRESSSFTDVFSWPKAYARQIITFCKNIATFKGLTTEDQLTLLKPFYLQVILLRAAFVYDRVRVGYPVLHVDFTTSQLSSKAASSGFAVFIKIQENELFRANPEINASNRASLERLKEEMENDSIIRDLIIGQTLFKCQEGLNSQEFIRQQFFVYRRLLARYLEHKYGNLQQTRAKVISLNASLEQLDLVIEQCRHLMADLDLAQFDNFLIELYDLTKLSL